MKSQQPIQHVLAQASQPTVICVPYSLYLKAPARIYTVMLTSGQCIIVHMNTVSR